MLSTSISSCIPTSTTTVTVTNLSTASNPARSPSDAGLLTLHLGPSDIAQNLSGIAAEFGAMMSTHIAGQLRTNHIETNCSINATKSLRNASTVTPMIAPTVSRAAMNLPSGRGSLIFLNTTSPDYVLVDHISATVFVWTEPARASTHDTKFHRIINKINAWLPFLEAVGIMTVAWEVGKVVQAQILKRRGRRAQSNSA